MVDVDKIIRFENGEMDHHEMVEMFQQMVDDDSVWSLQGFYGRTAAALIEAGYVEDTHNRLGKRGMLIPSQDVEEARNADDD